jgi:hypothetical protein
MKANLKALKKQILKAAKEGGMIGLTIGAIVGGAIGAPIYGVGAIANAAICGAIGFGIGAGIGALIVIIKAEKLARKNFAKESSNSDDNDEESEIIVNSSKVSQNFKLVLSIEGPDKGSPKDKSSVEILEKSEQPKLSKNPYSFASNLGKSLSDGDLPIIESIEDNWPKPSISG